MIQRLEALLERVRMRAAEPRRRRADAKAVEPEVIVEVDAPVVPREAPVERPEERSVADGYDSGERFVVAQRISPEPAPEEPAAGGRPSERRVEAVAEPDAHSEESEVMEEAPVSSRRTVVSEPEERLAEMAFGADELQQPIHTPPPESGRLPAAPVDEFDRDITGVRSATPVAPRRAGDPGPRELVPEVLQPKRAPSDEVVDVIVRAQRFAPSTFVALLDASLDL
jgi:hypothetical protein